MANFLYANKQISTTITHITNRERQQRHKTDRQQQKPNEICYGFFEQLWYFLSCSQSTSKKQQHIFGTGLRPTPLYCDSHNHYSKRAAPVALSLNVSIFGTDHLRQIDFFHQVSFLKDIFNYHSIVFICLHIWTCHIAKSWFWFCSVWTIESSINE